jgi:hypothetical protein
VRVLWFRLPLSTLTLLARPPSIASSHGRIGFSSRSQRGATYKNAAIGLGGAAGGVVLNYLPLSPFYLIVTAPFLLLGMMLGAGAIEGSIERRIRARRRLRWAKTGRTKPRRGARA